MVDASDPGWVAVSSVDAFVAGQEGAMKIVATDERVERIAVGADGSSPHRAVEVLKGQRSYVGDAAPTDCRAKRAIDIVHAQRDVADAVSMDRHVAGNGASRLQTGCEHKGDGALAEHVAR